VSEVTSPGDDTPKDQHIPAHLSVDAFVQYTTEIRSKKTANTYGRHAKKLLNWVELKDIDLFTARKAVLDDFVSWLADKDLAPATIRLSAVGAKAYLDWLRRNDVDIPDFVKPKVRKAPRPQAPVVLGDTGVEAFLDAADEHEEPFRTLMFILYCTGARSSEACNLKLEDVSVMELNGQQRFLLTLHGKGEKIRTIPIPLQYRTLFRTYMVSWRKTHHQKHQENTWLFPGRGDHIKERSLRQRLQQIKGQVGFPEFNAHILRKTYITHLSTSGMPPLMIAQLVGHATDATLAFKVTSKHYINHALEKIAVAMDKIPFTLPENA
jgi:integrase/recombinase XerD